MHSFVHGPSPPTCTAPHHEPISVHANDHLPKTLSPVGHRLVTARPNGSAVYAMEGGAGPQHVRYLFSDMRSCRGLLPWALATEQTRMDVVCRIVDGTARHGVEVVQAGCTAVRASTLITIDRIPSTLGGCVERMNVWRACGWRGRVQVVCPAKTESERQRCGPFTHPLAHQRVPPRYARVSHAARALPAPWPCSKP
jgi:hypothetical protein